MRSLLIGIVVCCAGSAGAQTPTAEVEVGMWSSEGRVDTTARAGLALDEDVRLDATWARPVERAGRGFAHGRLSVGRLRVVGGVLDDAGAVHVGYAPRLRVDLGGGVTWRGELDTSLGAAWIRRDGPLQRDVGPVDYPDEVDVLAGALRLGTGLGWVPWSPLELSAGVYAGTVAAVAPPRADRSGLLERYAQYTDLGITASYSRAAVGAYGQARLRLWRGRAWGGGWQLWARYREAWDWIHLDPVYSLLERDEGLAGYQLEAIPPRQTRLAGLVLAGGLGDWGLELGAEVRHVLDSTTQRDFADRPGWSLAASAALRWRRIALQAQARYHLQDDDRTPLLGSGARLSALAGVEVDLVRAPGFALTALATLRVGVPDGLGIVREGHAWYAGLRARFGGSRARLRDWPAFFPRPSGPRAWTGDRTPARVDEAVATAEGPPVEEAPLTQRDVEAALDLLPPHPETDRLRQLVAESELPTPSEIRGWIDGHPDVADEVEAQLPGLLDGIEALLSREPAAARPFDPQLVAGYGAGGVKVNLVQQRRASLFAVTSRVQGAASDYAETRRTVRLASDDAVFDRTNDALIPVDSGTHADLHGLLADQRLESFSVLAVERGRARMVFQGETAWSRGVLYLLTGRTD